MKNLRIGLIGLVLIGGLLISFLARADEEALYHGIRPSFVMNIQTDAGLQRYLLLKVDVVSRKQITIDALKDHDFLIKDRLLGYFVQLNADNLKTMKDKENLRDETLKVINEALQEAVGHSDVENVLFTEFILE